MPENSGQKTITFLIGSMRRGGAERVISILANHYAGKGWKVDILTFLDDSNEYILDGRIRFLPVCGEGKSQIKRIPYWIKTVRRYVKTQNPDRLVSFVTRINLITLFACLGLNKYIVVSERSGPAAPGRVPFSIMLLVKLLYPLAAHVVFQTKWAESCFSRRIRKKGVVLPNPVNVNVEAAGEKQKKIVAVGRLLEVKNHALLIRAFQQVLQRHPGYSLTIYGDGKLRAELEKQVSNAGLTGSVFLPGNVLDIHERIADAEIFVLSSNFEGFSNALVEAMMMGLPCISTKVSGSNDIIKTGINGILIDKRNEQQLADALDRLIADKQEALAMGAEAKRSVQHMRSENLIGLWEQCIEQSI